MKRGNMITRLPQKGKSTAKTESLYTYREGCGLCCPELKAAYRKWEIL